MECHSYFASDALLFEAARPIFSTSQYPASVNISMAAAERKTLCPRFIQVNKIHRPLPLPYKI